MDPTKLKSELSPLDQIRYAEGEVTRRVAAAREEAKRVEDRARKQARQMIAQARDIGRSEGEARMREIVANTQEEAKAILARAKNLSEELRRRGHNRIDLAVRQSEALIISVDETEESQSA